MRDNREGGNGYCHKTSGKNLLADLQALFIKRLDLSLKNREIGKCLDALHY